METVSIPFSSGRCFSQWSRHFRFLPYLGSLNPLLVGAVFLTRPMSGAGCGVCNVSIPFSSGRCFSLARRFTTKPSSTKKSQSPSRRGGVSHFANEEVQSNYTYPSQSPSRRGGVSHRLLTGARYHSSSVIVSIPFSSGRCFSLFKRAIRRHQMDASQSPSRRGGVSHFFRNGYVAVSAEPLWSQSPSRRGGVSHEERRLGREAGRLSGLNPLLVGAVFLTRSCFTKG